MTPEPSKPCANCAHVKIGGEGDGSHWYYCGITILSKDPNDTCDSFTQKDTTDEHRG